MDKQGETMQLTYDMLPQAQRELAEIIGLEAYLQLSERYGGDVIYIMKSQELLRPSRNREMTERFDGYNYRELAREYGLSVRMVYEIVRHVVREKRCAPIPGQINFEELL